MSIAFCRTCKIPNHHLLLGYYALQEARKRNAIVKRIGFISQEVNATVRVMLAQCLRRCCTCDAIAYDDIVFLVSCQKRLSLSWIDTSNSLEIENILANFQEESHSRKL